MFKVIFVDDIAEMVKFLVNTIPWSEYGFEIAGYAYNGVDALKLVHEVRPDIIITDITMPVMGGMELIREARKIKADVKSIILTCHEDFKYAKEAIQLEVENYLVKDTLTGEELTEVMSKIGRKLLEEKNNKEKTYNINLELNSNRTLLEEKFFSDVIKGNAGNKAAIFKKADIMDINLPKGHFRVIGGFVDDFKSEIAGSPINEEDLFKFSVLNIVDDVLQNGHPIKSFSASNGVFAILYWDGTETIHVKKKLMTELENIIGNIKAILKVGLSFCIGGIYQDITQLGLALKEIHTLRQAYFYAGTGKITVQRKSYPKQDMEEFYGRYEAVLKSALSRGNRVEICSMLLDIMDYAEKSEFSPEYIEWLMKKFMYEMELEAIKYGFSVSNLFEKSDTFHGNKIILMKIVEIYSAKVQETKNSVSRRKEVNFIIDYIEEHLHEDISVEMMAALLKLNRSYLSRLFKNETGESLSDYLIGKRIEKASILLKSSDMTIEEITNAVGLDDVSYFYKMFRKHTGKTPREVRRGM